jgi:hypothetical protein
MPSLSALKTKYLVPSDRIGSIIPVVDYWRVFLTCIDLLALTRSKQFYRFIVIWMIWMIWYRAFEFKCLKFSNKKNKIYPVYQINLCRLYS